MSKDLISHSIACTDDNNGEKERTETIKGDDPCWGGVLPDQHDLHFLLKKIYNEYIQNVATETASVSSMPDNSKTGTLTKPLVVYESSEYIVLNKPPDLRMDGPYLATVHKLLTYWYPTPHILQQLPPSTESMVYNEETHGLKINQYLINIVQTLPNHNSLVDNRLRPCHQLDYATSGILLVAKSKRAASFASQAFENRTTRKTYIAVVREHIDTEKIPLIPNSLLQTWTSYGIVEEEKQYRLRKKNIHKNTFKGFMPVHAIFGKWKAIRIKEKSGFVSDSDSTQESKQKWNRPIHEVGPNERRKRGDNAVNNDILDTNAILTPEEEKILLNLKWSDAKNNQKFNKLFNELAQRYNAAQKSKQEENEENTERKRRRSHPSIPHVFRIDGEDSNIFYVQASIAEPPLDDFRMMLHPSAIPPRFSSVFLLPDTKNLTSSTSTSHYPEDFKPLDYKPAFTKCIISSKGYYHPAKSLDANGIPITKLELHPHTGRRHQLRLHMLACGHPILGDITYELNTEHEQNASKTCPRMCLHAWKLSIPLRDKSMARNFIEQKLGMQKDKKDSTQIDTENIVERAVFVAPDPFCLPQMSNIETNFKSNLLQVNNFFTHIDE